MSQEEKTPPLTPAKPNWLEQLSDESWQAELIISGVAIFGSFQLIDLVNRLVDWMYFALPEELMGFAYFLCWYLFIAVAVLIVSFLVHFAIRALWIAAMGLLSVFPQGIKRDNELMSPHFMDQLIEKFPSFRGFIENLDQIGSSILAYAFTFVLSFAGIGIMLGLVLILGYGLSFWLPKGMSFYIVIGLIGIAVFGLFFSAMLNSKSFRDKPWVKKYHFRLTLLFGGYIISNFFYRPVMYLMYTIRTNVNTKLYWGALGGMMVMILFLASSLLSNSNLLSLMEPLYRRYDVRADRIYAENYADQIDKRSLALLSPIVPSEFISDPNAFNLFLPMPEREERMIFLDCGEFQPPVDETDRDRVRELRYQYRLDCFRSHLSLRLNGRPLRDYVLKVHNYSHRGEPGLLYYFPNIELQAGENILTIEHFWQNDSGKRKIDRVPFFFTGSSPE